MGERQADGDVERAWRTDPWGRARGDADALRDRIAPHLDAPQADALVAILAGADRALGLADAVERIEVDTTSSARPILVMRTSHGGIVEPDIHLADVMDGDDVATLATQIGWSARGMAEELASRRAWALAGTAHPPLETMETTPVTRAFLDHHGCDAGQLLRSTWRPPAAYGHPWRSSNREPGFRVNRAPQQVSLLEIPEGLPWCCGRNTTYELTLSWIDLGRGSSYDANNGRYRRGKRPGEPALDIPARLPDVAAIALRGRPLRDAVSHPVLDRFAYRIRAVEPLAASMRLHLDGVDPDPRVPLADGPRPHLDWAETAARTLRDGIAAFSA